MRAVALLDDAQDIVAPIEKRLDKMWQNAISVMPKWWTFLPGVLQSPVGVHMQNALWLYFCYKAYGVLEFARDRYKMLWNNTQKHWQKWSLALSESSSQNVNLEELHAACSFDWAPGFDLSVILERYPFEQLPPGAFIETNADGGTCDAKELMAILHKAHEVLSPPVENGSGGEDTSSSSRAVDMRPIVDFPDQKIPLKEVA